MAQRASPRLHIEIYQKIISSARMLSEMNIRTCLGWILGHAGIQFNDKFDNLARETAQNIYTEEIPAPSIITKALYFPRSAEILRHATEFQ